MLIPTKQQFQFEIYRSLPVGFQLDLAEFSDRNEVSTSYQYRGSSNYLDQ
jgi:hypothetical protein